MYIILTFYPAYFCRYYAKFTLWTNPAVRYRLIKPFLKVRYF